MKTDERVLVTGGAGFIGRAVVRDLLAAGAHVRILDSLVEQVHGPTASPPPLKDVEFIRGDTCDPHAVRDALRGVDSIIHLAAEVGVGQSMYAIRRYTEANDLGTAVLLEEMIKQPVRRIVTASSMSIYGEGLYADARGIQHDAVTRDPVELRRHNWDPTGKDGTSLTPLPTPESKRPSLASIYAIGKYVQEQMTLTVAPAYGIEAVALRFWNVFGPGQALSNPYTGVLAIFASRLSNGQPPIIFEDGQQMRDFVHVDDIARAVLLALTATGANGAAINIASGASRNVIQVAESLAKVMGVNLQPEITNQGRAGDVRHCIPDLGLARDLLGYRAREDFETRLGDLAEWVLTQDAVDKVGQATIELKERGLVV